MLKRRRSPVCTCQGGAETLIARSPAKSLHDMRIRALKTHSAPRSQRQVVQAWTLHLWLELRATVHLHHLSTPRDLPAVCLLLLVCAAIDSRSHPRSPSTIGLSSLCLPPSPTISHVVLGSWRKRRMRLCRWRVWFFADAEHRDLPTSDRKRP
jgi:hypothetical protein